MPDATLSKQLQTFARGKVRGIAEARQAAALILRYAADPDAHDADPMRAWGTSFHDALAVLQGAADEHAANELRREALPALRAVFDRRYQRWRGEPSGDEHDPRTIDLLFALKIFAMYGGAEQDERVVTAARDGMDREGFMWSVVLGALAHAGERGLPVLNAISRPLPDGFIGVALLDAANELARANLWPAHPFDCAEGLVRLRAWLTDSAPENASYAHSATVALPFIQRPARGELLALAEHHAEASVRIEAAWARGRLGDVAGIDALRTFASDPRTSSVAIRYLEELGRGDAVPEEAADPTFRAMAESIEWLAHPQEMGRAPDSIELYDHRVAFWPPTNDERPLWLFRYGYHDDSAAEGLVMFGSVTFALFGEVTAVTVQAAEKLDHSDHLRVGDRHADRDVIYLRRWTPSAGSPSSRRSWSARTS